MNSFLPILSPLVLLLYPIGVYWGLKTGHHFWILVAVLLGLTLRPLVFRSPGVRSSKFIPSIVLGAVLLGLASWYRTDQALLFFPVLANLAGFMVFASSLMWPPTLVERIAERMDGALPPEGRQYCHKVTQVWSLFFLVNGGLAFFTAVYCSVETWTWYNGFVSYVLLGTLFAIEWTVRQRVKRRIVAREPIS